MITLADAKRNIRVGSDVTFEDGLVYELVRSATRYLERRTGWHLAPVETLTVFLHGNGTRIMWLPQPPSDPESVTVEDPDEDPVEDFTVRGRKLVRTAGWTYGVEYAVAFDAGYEPGTGPTDLMQATRLLVAGWFENREAWTVGEAAEEHKQGVDRLVGAYERVRA